MPAKAGIHLRFRWQAKKNLDSGLRRNDQTKSRLLVDEFRTPRLGAEVHSVDSANELMFVIANQLFGGGQLPSESS